MTIRIMLVDDQSAVRRGLKMSLALEPDMTVVGEAGDGVEALKLARELRPDVVVMDVVMPRMDGMAALEALHTVAPGAAVVILTLHDTLALRAQAREAEAAFVAKHEGVGALVAAIRQVAGGARA
jgi:DNA-binding NarL/FixJ family response regulator